MKICGCGKKLMIARLVDLVAAWVVGRGGAMIFARRGKFSLGEGDDVGPVDVVRRRL